MKTKQYCSLLSTQHTNFEVQLSQLHIDTQHPNLAATPDCIVSCDCCGVGLLEIFYVLTFSSVGCFYLQKNSAGTLQLGKTHEYYTEYKHCYPRSSPILYAAPTWNVYMWVRSSRSQFVLSLLFQVLPELTKNKKKKKKKKLTGNLYDPHSKYADDSDGEDGVFCNCREPEYGVNTCWHHS